MSEEHRKINYDLAKAEADKVDEQIIAALQNGISFRVEAGAGSGKTYSLNKAIEMCIRDRHNVVKLMRCVASLNR